MAGMTTRQAALWISAYRECSEEAAAAREAILSGSEHPSVAVARLERAQAALANLLTDHRLNPVQ